jgi:hypothetical protein
VVARHPQVQASQGSNRLTVHYHGCPITPTEVRNQLAGRCFCVRYGEHRDDEWAHTHGQSVLLDNGAFSVWRQGKTPDWPGYYAWAERWLEHPTTWAVIPDSITGDEAENDALLVAWTDTYLPRGAPVWHLHESIDRLLTLCDLYERVCLGSSGQYAAIGTPQWHRRMTEAMNAVCGSGPVPVWLHGLRMMSLAGSGYPLASVDSTDIARNHAGNNGGKARKDAAAMAARWDSRQCPSRWTVHEQLAFVPHPVSTP